MQLFHLDFMLFNNAESVSKFMSWDSTVSIAAKLRGGWPRSRDSILGTGKRFFRLLRNIRSGSGIHPTSCPMGFGGSLPGREADHPPPFSAMVSNGRVIPQLPQASSKCVV
jgi:hypothetical protein